MSSQHWQATFNTVPCIVLSMVVQWVAGQVTPSDVSASLRPTLIGTDRAGACPDEGLVSATQALLPCTTYIPWPAIAYLVCYDNGLIARYINNSCFPSCWYCAVNFKITKVNKYKSKICVQTNTKTEKWIYWQNSLPWHCSWLLIDRIVAHANGKRSHSLLTFLRIVSVRVPIR